jgi:hypothetical protein
MMARMRQPSDGRRASIREQADYRIQRRNRHWEVRDPVGDLVCLTAYKRGAEEVVRRMTSLQNDVLAGARD